VRRDGENKEGEARFRVAVGGLYEFGRYLYKPTVKNPGRVAFGPVYLTKPFEINPATESVVVWAMGGGEGMDLENPGEVEARLKTLPWVMLLRLRAERKGAR
jgi:hypothetical protein